MLGANSFTNALITLTFTGNTSNVTGGPSLFFNVAGPGVVTINVAGIGTATFLDNIEVFANNFSSAVGFEDASIPADILDAFGAGFSSYDLTTAIGPLTGGSAINSGLVFSTTAGNFDIATAGNATFTAITGAPAVPEPSSLVLLGTSILGLAGVVRRKLSL